MPSVMGLVASLVLVLTGSVIPTTPEEFLLQLADSSTGYDGARFWLNRLSPRAPESPSDISTMREMLHGRTELSVNPGRMSLVELDSASGYYRVEFPGSEWTWTDSAGRVRRSRGNTTVDYVDGRFYWVEMPIDPYELSAAGKFQVGFLLTILVMLTGGVIVVLARRSLLKG